MGRIIQKTVICVAVLFAGVLFLAFSESHAALLGFDNITNNNSGNAAIGEAQLTVDVTDAGSNQVLFTFDNSGPDDSSITDVYFDDGSLLGIASVFNGTGVDFSQGANPGDLPGGNDISPPFVTTAGFSADSEPPAQPNGVNPGETLGILFNLQTGQTFADVLAELGDGTLRIGIHVQGFADGGSESFVNTPVPIASSFWLIGAGFVGVWGAMRKKFLK
jgi:hypothetical protein